MASLTSLLQIFPIYYLLGLAVVFSIVSVAYFLKRYLITFIIISRD